MFVIPALDLIDGKCVRLTEGDYDKKTVYDQDPVEVAKRFEAEGAEWFHVVDLDGAKAGQPVNHEVIAAVVKATTLKVEVGGGVRTLRDVKMMRDLGVTRMVMGSRLAEDMEMAEALFHQFGEGIVAGIDTKNGYVAVHGWTSTSKILGTDLARNLARLGCKRVVFTDVARDGTFAGSNLVATREMVTATEMKVVASGGVASIDDVKAVKATGAEAVIVGKALYEGRLSLLEVKEAGL